MRAITPRYLFGGSGIEVRGVLLRPGATVQLPGSPNDGRHLPHPYPTIWSHLRGIFNIQMTRWAAGAYFLSNRSCGLAPASQDMTSRSCGLVQQFGTAVSATPHPDPSGGQAPRLAKSSTALHFLIPPSAIGLQFGMIRRWRAGIEVDRRAHFRTIDETGKSNGCHPSRFGVRDTLSYQ